MKPLNENQKKALKMIPKRWGFAPYFVHISTLMSLRKRGLVEIKPLHSAFMCFQIGMMPVYKLNYRWRRTAAAKKILEGK